MRIINVRPLADGWTIHTDWIANDLVFHSGGAAERAALDLADRLAQAGTPCEIHIYLRDGSLGGRFIAPVFRAAVTVPGAGNPTADRPTSRTLEPA